jgi:colanic acid biosynthesis protein WcaH
MLSKEDFSNVVKNTPIIAVDFIVINNENKILLGKRNNNPAKDYYFTLGGVIRKEETIKEATRRISENELNYPLYIDSLKFNGVFEFIYKENFLDNEDFSTHYIVLSYIFYDIDNVINPYSLGVDDKYKNQHEEFIWLSKEEILNNNNMHKDLKELIKKIR